MAAGPGVTGIEGWRVALLLVGFIIVTLSFEGLINYVEKRLKKRKGLLTAFRALKNELLYLGFLSLLLSVTQEYLARICIPHTHGSSYDKYKKKYNLADNCAEGKEPLWPVSVQHETHYFIFAVAVTHILYCALTIALTLRKVATWRPWEDAALKESKSSSGDVKVMQETVSRSLIRSMCTSALAAMSGHRSPLELVAHLKAVVTSLAAQFRVSVSQPMYHNVRLLFIEKMGLTYDFDFHALVTNGMENQLAHAVHASWPLWMIATLFLVLPTPSYVPFWSYCLVMLMMFVVGAKLVSITALLGMQVAIKYGDSVLFGRMDMEPRALVRTGPARRRMSLSQLADSLGDAIDNAATDGIFTADGGGSGEGGGTSNAAGGEGAAATGAHVLDEALPPGAGAEVQAQVAAIAALTSREEALNLLRTMASKPLLPEHPSTQQEHQTSNDALEPSLQLNAAAAVSTATARAADGVGADANPEASPVPAITIPGGDVPSAASTSTLLPSPSLLLGIAPPRWGPRPAAPPLLLPAPMHQHQQHHPPHKKKKSLPPPPVRLPVPTPTTPPADITPLSPVLNSVVGTPASVSAFSVISSTSALAPPSSASPAKPLQGGVGGDVTITVMGSDEAPTAAPSAAADPRPSTDGASGLGGIDQLAASVRPPAIRPPTAGLERPISAARPSTAVGSQPPLSVLLPTPRVTQSPGTAIVPPFAATMRTSSRGLNAAVAAASWANATTRRNTSRPSAGLMLCGVATSRARTALEQMEEAMAIAATAVEMSAGQHQELVAPPASTSAAGGGGGGGGEIRPLTPPATPGGGVAGFLASLRPSRVARVTEDSRTLLDGSPSTEPVDVGIRSPRVTMRHISRMAMTLTRIAGQIASPAPTTTGTGVGGAAGNDVAAAVPADAHVIDPIAAAAIAAKAAATLICQLSPRRPIRRCMSARQLMCTTHIGEEDFSRTLVRRQPAAANNATIANCGVCAPNGKAVVLRPGGVQDDSSIGLQAGLAGADLLPAPRFGAPKAAAVAASASPDLHPSIPHLPKFPKLSAAALPISFFGPRKKAKKSHRQSGGAAEGTGDKASGDGGGGDGEDCAGKAADVSAPLQAAERSSSPERQELVSVTGVAAELSGSSMAESPAAAAKDAAAAEASRPESGGKPGVQAPQSRGGAVASAFALFQVKVQQSPGGNDESAAYDSLSALLPPPMPMSPGSMASMIPGFVRGTGSSDRANFDQSTVSDHPGSSSAAAPIAGNSAAYDPTATNTHRTRMEPAVSAHAVTSAEVGGGGGGGDDGGAAAASAAALPAAVASSDSIPFPSPPELSLSPEVSRPRSGLRIVRVGDNGPWISVQEAVALAMGTSGLDSMESGVEATAAGAASATATSAAPWRYGEESEYENGFGYEDESGASAPQHGTRLLLPNTSGFREAALLERPLPRRDRGVGGAGGQGASTLPPRVLASVFSMNTSASSESASDIPVPPPCPSQQDSTAGELESRSYASVGAGGGGIRTAASMGGSGDLSGVDVDVEPCKECGDELDVDGYYGLVASAGGDELTYGGGDSPFADDPARHRLAAAAAAAAGAAERAPSSRAEADLPSTPGATGLPMIPHSLETVEEGDEEAAEAEMVEAETEAYRKSRRGSDAAASACGITEGNVIGKVSEGDQEMGSVRLSQPLLPPPRPLSAGVIVGDGNDSDSVRYDTREDSLGGGGSGAAATWSRERPEQAPLEDPSDGYPTGDPEPELESTFTGFGIVKLNRTAPRIGMGTALRDLPTPPRMPARMVGSLRSESRMQPSGSSVSLMSLAPWVGDEGFGPEGGSAGGGGSEFASRAPSEAADGQSRCSASGGDSRPESAAMVAEENGEARKDSRLGRNVRSVFGSAASQDDEEDGDGEAEEMPPPPPPPAAPPAAPPPPSHQRSGPMLIAGGSGSGDGDGAAVSVADGSRWAVAVPPSLRSGPTRGVAVHNIISATTIYGSVRTCVHPAGGNGGGDHIGMLHGHVGGICNWDDPWAGPVCEGSGTLAEGSNGLKTAEIPPSLSPLPALPPPDSTANGATSVSPFGEESLRTTAAGIAAGHIWRDRAKEHDEEHRTGGGGGGPIWHGQNSHSSLLALLGAHHSRNSGRQHNHCHHHHNHHNHLGHGSDSESDDGGCCHTIWPPCIPKPWHHPRVVPLPAPVRDLKDNLAAGVDKAKVALTNAAGDVADTVKEKLRYGSRSTSKQQPHQQLQRKISDHWLERVRNMLAAHKGFENMDASAFFWFHNPKVIAYVFNWAYYENSLSIAMLLFSLILGYQEKWVFKGVPMWAVLLLLFADLLILVHSCFYVLPLYALIMPVGSHCPKEVLRRALKAGVFTRQTALIAKALHLQLKARESVAAAAAAAPAAPKSSFIDRITQRLRKSSGLPPVVTAAAATTAFSRAGQNAILTNPTDALSPGGGGGGGGWNKTLSHQARQIQLLLSPSGAAGRVSGRINAPISPRGADLSALIGGGGGGGGGRLSGIEAFPTVSHGAAVCSVKEGDGGAARGCSKGLGDVNAGGNAGHSYSMSLKVIDLTESGQSGDLRPTTFTSAVYGDEVAKPALIPRKDAVTAVPPLGTRTSSSGGRDGGESAGCGGSTAVGLAPSAWPGPEAPDAKMGPASGGSGTGVSSPGDLPYHRQQAGAAAVAAAAGDRPCPSQPIPVPSSGKGPLNRRRAGDTAGAAHPAPSRLSRMMQHFRTAPPPPPPAIAADPPRNGNSHHGLLGNADDDVVPFTGSGAPPSPSDNMMPGLAAATEKAPRLSLQGSCSSPMGIMDLSLTRGANLERQGSGDSLSSSLGRSGTVRALMSGMYRGAVAHLTPEERQEAAARGLALGRAAGQGRARLDMTLVPEK